MLVLILSQKYQKTGLALRGVRAYYKNLSTCNNTKILSSVTAWILKPKTSRQKKSNSKVGEGHNGHTS